MEGATTALADTRGAGRSEKPLPRVAYGVKRHARDLASVLDKLEVYRRLGVREVWVWEAGRITPWFLGAAGYTRGRKSRVLPDFDLALLSKFVTRVDQHAAVKAWRLALRSN